MCWLVLRFRFTWNLDRLEVTNSAKVIVVSVFMLTAGYEIQVVVINVFEVVTGWEIECHRMFVWLVNEVRDKASEIQRTRNDLSI